MQLTPDAPTPFPTLPGQLLHQALGPSHHAVRSLRQLIRVAAAGMAADLRRLLVGCSGSHTVARTSAAIAQPQGLVICTLTQRMCPTLSPRLSSTVIAIVRRLPYRSVIINTDIATRTHEFGHNFVRTSGLNPSSSEPLLAFHAPLATPRGPAGPTPRFAGTRAQLG